MLSLRIHRLTPKIITLISSPFCETSQFFSQSRQFWRPPSPQPKLSAKSPQSVQQLLQSYILEHCPKLHPLKTLEFIDRYCQMSWMMNFGPQKRNILEKVFSQNKIRKVLEIGTYCGYSALALSQCPLVPQAKITSLQINKKHAEIARRIIAHSGVKNINVLSETMYEAVSYLNQSGPFDLIFMDQNEQQYTKDLHFLEQRNLIRTGGVVIADNILYPGAPEYLSFMKDASTRKQYRSTLYHSYDAYTDIPDAVLVSVKVF